MTQRTRPSESTRRTPHVGAAGRRIVVVGTTGSGKTTVAAELAKRLRAPHIELDALHWGPAWTEVPDDVFRERTREAVARDSWVADGNYHQIRDILWPRADAILWLDYSFPVIFRRLAARTIRRCLTGETLWSGNRERLWTQLCTRDSLFLWLCKTYWRRRREYPALFRLPQHAHLEVVRLSSPRQTRAWLVAGATAMQGRVEGLYCVRNDDA